MIVAVLVIVGVAVSSVLALQSRRTQILCDELRREVEHERHELRNLAVIARGAERRADRVSEWVFQQTKGVTVGKSVSR